MIKGKLLSANEFENSFIYKSLLVLSVSINHCLPTIEQLFMFSCLSGSKSTELCQESGSQGSDTVIGPEVQM